ncbi:unnamed protein product [Spodoptera littoralis]|uniref:Uncharacterized protein n=1 Tax=Spodoptera littoralis TaxID=7109 RepID=A0A9P0NAH3_SPOLI|nr:unnamed protein product [Spodoptera littoralis]CAH1645743.1 unnamed protein product [Spodoptera littoralis]
MSGEPEVTRTPEEEEEEEIKSSYKPPPEKTIDEILAADQEDESLRKYKEALLGEAQAGAVIVDPNDPRRVIVKKLALCVTGRDDVELDLSGDLTDLKKQVRPDMIMVVDKMTHMVGSYPPKTEIQSYTTPPEDAPSGMVARGSYSVNSLFTDDDKNVHLQWEWCFDIKKDWKD